MSDPILLTKPPGFDEIIPQEYLVESDGEPMDSPWHLRAMSALIRSAAYHFRLRKDFYTGGNMFIYFSPEQARNKDFRGPDFFFVWNTNRYPDRRFWYLWEERRTPNVVIELVSPSTRDEDHGPKKSVYEQILKVSDYFCFDPDGNVLEGWHLHGREYGSLTPNEKGWLWCEELQLWLGPWQGMVDDYEGTYPRFFSPAGNLIVTSEEAALLDAQFQRERADKRTQEADEQRRQADEQRRQVDEQRRQIDEQKQRADKADAELAVLRERLALLETAATGRSESSQ